MSVGGIFREYLHAALVALVLALFVRSFCLESFKIPSGSMEDNLQVGDHLVVNKQVYGPVALPAPLSRLLPRREVRRGDVVVFKAPDASGRDFIKRCVAVAGDVVEIRRKRLFVNGVEVAEPHIRHDDPTDRGWPRDHFGPYLVPSGHLFVLGDNRDDSRDSRYFKAVRADALRGRALLVYWSVRPHREGEAGEARLASLADLPRRFITDTRWRRCLRLIR